MGKVEIGIYADVFVLQKCSLSSPLLNMYMNFFQTAEFNWFPGLVAMATKTLSLHTHTQIISSEAIMGMKLKLYRNVHNIRLYKKNVFYCRRSCAFVAMATYSFHSVIMGNLKKVGLHFYLTADVLTKVLQKCSLSSPLLNI